MLALLTIQGVVLVIKIQDVLFSLESKLLVQEHGRVTGRDVQGHILAHAGLQKRALVSGTHAVTGTCG